MGSSLLDVSVIQVHNKRGVFIEPGIGPSPTRAFDGLRLQFSSLTSVSQQARNHDRNHRVIIVFLSLANNANERRSLLQRNEYVFPLAVYLSSPAERLLSVNLLRQPLHVAPRGTAVVLCIRKGASINIITINFKFKLGSVDKYSILVFHFFNFLFL